MRSTDALRQPLKTVCSLYSWKGVSGGSQVFEPPPFFPSERKRNAEGQYTCHLMRSQWPYMPLTSNLGEHRASTGTKYKRNKIQKKSEEYLYMTTECNRIPLNTGNGVAKPSDIAKSAQHQSLDAVTEGRSRTLPMAWRDSSTLNASAASSKANLHKEEHCTAKANYVAADRCHIQSGIQPGLQSCIRTFISCTQAAHECCSKAALLASIS